MTWWIDKIYSLEMPGVTTLNAILLKPTLSLEERCLPSIYLCRYFLFIFLSETVVESSGRLLIF